MKFNLVVALSMALVFGMAGCGKKSDSGATAAATSDPLTADQLKSFGERFANAWCGPSGKVNRDGGVQTHRLRDIRRETTTSTLHPVEYVFVVDDVGAGGANTTFNFRFFWNGSRLEASDSTAQGTGGVVRHPVVDALDKSAREVQANKG